MDEESRAENAAHRDESANAAAPEDENEAAARAGRQEEDR
jgi:hypothetical protein